MLFIGNSFTFCYGSVMRFYQADTIRDLNLEGQGGVPALFKSFTQQVGLDYGVAIETRSGTGIDWHMVNRLSVINQRPWDIVVAHGFSTLDAQKPADATKLVETAMQLAAALQAGNPCGKKTHQPTAAKRVRVCATGSSRPSSPYWPGPYPCVP